MTFKIFRRGESKNIYSGMTSASLQTLDGNFTTFMGGRAEVNASESLMGTPIAGALRFNRVVWRFDNYVSVNNSTFTLRRALADSIPALSITFPPTVGLVILEADQYLINQDDIMDWLYNHVNDGGIVVWRGYSITTLIL